MASGAVATGKSAWSQLDGLLTCAICLDRYRNPKLLPCQHTFCMEPCLEGLIDYVRRQIKCPECRAEHRIPYQGIQGYPTNVTLMRFLELHFAVTGEEPDTSPTVMERCAVCSEKSYLTHCGHCDKKACAECKEAHLDILKREISRINNQVRRGLHRLQEALDQADKSSQQFQTNCTRVLDDIGDTSRRLQKAIKDREESLRNQVQNFLQSELKSATQMKEGLETEVSNIQSNCELIETHVTENSDWEDVELVDYKDIFLKTIEFLRSFDPDTSDFNRRLKFSMGPGDPDAMYHSVANFGDLTINATQFGSAPTPLVQGVTSSAVTGSSVTGGGMLMRSKSDHRLASQFQRNEEIRMSSSYLGLAQRDNESRDGRTSPLSSRRRAAEYGDSSAASRRAREADDVERGNYSSGRRYNYTSDARSNKDRDREDLDGGYRSRFAGEILRDNSDSDIHSSRSVRFARNADNEPAPVPAAPPREKVFETEDATRGPLSGIARLMDSPRVMERLQQNEQRRKLKEIKDQQPPAPTPVPIAPQLQTAPRPRTGRQVSEDDEIAKIKAQNKGQETVAASAAASVTTTTVTTTTPLPPPPESPTRPVTRRVAALQSKEDTRGVGRRSGGDERPPSREGSGDGYESASSRPPSRQSTASDTKDAGKSVPDHQASEDDKAIHMRRAQNRSAGGDKSMSVGSKVRVGTGGTAAIAETASESDSDTKTSQEGSTSSNAGSDSGALQNAADDTSGQEKPNYFRFRTAAYSRTPSNSSVNLNSPDSPDESSGPQSPLTPHTPAAIDNVKSTDSSSAGSPEASPRRPMPATVRDDRKLESPDLSQRRVEESRLAAQGRSASIDKSDVTFDRPKPRFTSRFLPRTSSLKESDDVPHSARNPHPAESDTESSCSDSDDDKPKDSKLETPRHSLSSVTMSTRSATDADVTAILTRSALARKENAAHVSRDRDRQEASSTSSYSRLYGRDRDQESSAGKTAGRRTSGTTTSSRYDATDPGASEGRYSSLASRYSTRSKNAIPDDDEIGSRYSRYLPRSKSSAALGLEEAGSGGGGGSGGSGSTDRYGKKDYGGSRYAGGSAAANLRRSRLARSRSSHDIHPDDEDEERDDDEPSSSTYRSSRFERPSDYSLSRSRSHHALSSPRDSPREQSPDDAGGRGDSSGLSPWARYLRNKYGTKSRENSKDGGTASCSTARSIGRSRTASNLYSREASSESSDDERGSGVTSHDSSSRRDSPSVSHCPGYAGLNSPRSAYAQKRRMVMKIGSRGSEPGCFTWPRGIAVGPENSVVVADSSNHRVQVFDHQGSFCKEFGCYGSAEGEFDCLAGVAVNRIGQFIVSDRYNHRIQVFDPSGRFLRSFGSQGTGDGRLSYPWGIATDSLGFIYVCDKENHRVQVFQSDGTFVGKFGTLGSKTGQLEHPHYVAVSNTNKVIVSDSNNHRVQVFDVNGRVLSSFGSEGSDDGQFKFPRGVAVDDQGYIIVGDSGNNRIQIFNPDGSFLKAFGTWGSADGEFKGLEGIAVTSNGNILVCDRENHRIQVF